MSHSCFSVALCCTEYADLFKHEGLCNPWLWQQLETSIGTYQKYQLYEQLFLWLLLLEN